MLRVIAILEGGLDLEKGEEIPRSIVVTNGTNRVTIPVPESKVQELVGLFAAELGVQETSDTEQRKPLKRPPAPRPSVPPAQRPVVVTTPLFEQEPAPTMADDNELGPGEEYSESGTGVSSL